MKIINYSLLLLAFVSTSVVALDGGKATLVSDGAQTQVEFLEPDKLRVAEPNTGGYMLMTDGKLYTVMSEGGQTMVIDLAAAMASMGDAMQQEGFWDEEIQSVKSVEATGDKEMVAGIEGEVYEMTFVNGQGQTETSTLVLSDNPQVAALTRVMHRMSDDAPDASRFVLPAEPMDLSGMYGAGK